MVPIQVWQMPCENTADGAQTDVSFFLIKTLLVVFLSLIMENVGHLRYVRHFCQNDLILMDFKLFFL